MDRSLASLVDNLSEINKKKKNRWMNLLTTLDLCWLHYHVILYLSYSEINKKIRKSENKFIDNLRSASSSLSYHLNNLSEINK